MKISIIVPSFNEGDNVAKLAGRIAAAIQYKYDYELLFVDDSTDDTPQHLSRLAERDTRVRAIHRTEGRGLASAVIDGFKLAQGDVWVVMDADLQHPPESLPLVLEALDSSHDLIIPSRFIPGGDDGGLNLYRKFVSWTARTIARIALRKVRRVTDPTGGYFAVRRSAVPLALLNPIGWKIMLEMIQKGRYSGIKEVPYHFQARDLGASKLTVKQHFLYLAHIVKLVASSEEDARLWRFGLVGLSGVAVNAILYTLLVHLGAPVAAAFLLASLAALMNNFVWHDRYTWSSDKRYSTPSRFARFISVCSVGLIMSTTIVHLLHDKLSVHYMLAGCLGIGASVAWNYIVNHNWTFRKKTI